MKTDTNLSRRRLLAGVPAVAAAGVPSVATALGGLATGDDPIFAAIGAYNGALAKRAALSRFVRTRLDVVPPGHITALLPINALPGSEIASCAGVEMLR